MIISQSPKVIFIHIPRTGGTTLRHLFGFPLVGHQCYAKTLKATMSEDDWKSYFKFTIVRNPWDRTVSMYFYSKTIPGRVAVDETFPQWLGRTYGKSADSFQNQFYSNWFRDHTGEFLVDNIFKYENYETDVRKIADQFALTPSDMPLPHINKTEREHYSVYYDAASKDIVANMYGKDIEFFGYEF